MSPQVDHEAVTFARPYEQPEGRFGATHIPRNEIPAIHPEVLDFMEKQEAEEAMALARLAEERRGAIAVADTVEVTHHNGSYYP